MNRMRSFPGRLAALGCLLVSAALLAAPAVSATAPAAPSAPDFRLGDGVVPTHYDLDLTVDPARDHFTGQVRIDVRLARPTATIWLNATELELLHGEVAAGGQTLDAELVQSGDDFAGLRLDQPVGPGTAVVTIAFRGAFATTSTRGLFRQEADGHWYAFSQFEAIDARRAFPCFDEPGFKAPWRTSLTVPDGLEAFSNTPRSSEEAAAEGMKTVRFAETKPLPTYLVALGVGPFEVVPAGRAGRGQTPLRIITLHGKAGQAAYAKSVLPAILDHLESYYGIPFPFAKLDSLTIPQTVNFGAMENAGLITYAEEDLIAPKGEDSVSFRRGTTSVMAHEMAHQWTGDLVTPEWWNDIWLNESFATWMARKIVRELHPEWKQDVSQVESRSRAMDRDTLVSARKIRQPVVAKADIVNAFDGITYGKGAAVIAMFESWMGPERFRQGVHHYLESHAYGNATADDFLAALEAAGGEGIVGAFSTFLDQPGLPRVQVSLSCAEGAAPAVELVQRRLLPPGSPPAGAALWQVPMCLRYGVGGTTERKCLLLRKAQETVALAPAGPCPDWLLANDGEVGYYRASYQGDLLDRLLAASGELSEAETVGLIGDTAALARADALPMKRALALVPRFAGSDSRHVVQTLAEMADEVGDSLVSDELRPQYRRFILQSFGERAEALGWTGNPGESEEEQLLRRELVPIVAVDGEDPELGKEAGALARRWLADHSVVESDVAGALLQVAAWNGDQALFDACLAAAKKEPERRDRRRLLFALGAFRSPELAHEALGLLLRDDFDPREAIEIPFAMIDDPATREVAWSFLEKNFDALTARLPAETVPYLPYFASEFCDEAHAADAKAFFSPHAEQFPGLERNLAQVLERIHQCAAERKAQGPSVAEFLAAY